MFEYIDTMPELLDSDAKLMMIFADALNRKGDINRAYELINKAYSINPYSASIVDLKVIIDFQTQRRKLDDLNDLIALIEIVELCLEQTKWDGDRELSVTHSELIMYKRNLEKAQKSSK